MASCHQRAEVTRGLTTEFTEEHGGGTASVFFFAFRLANKTDAARAKFISADQFHSSADIRPSAHRCPRDGRWLRSLRKDEARVRLQEAPPLPEDCVR